MSLSRTGRVYGRTEELPQTYPRTIRKQPKGSLQMLMGKNRDRRFPRLECLRGRETLSLLCKWMILLVVLSPELFLDLLYDEIFKFLVARLGLVCESVTS